MALPTINTPIAKSLHTLTVLQQVTNLYRRMSNDRSLEECLENAMETLGLAGRPDPYGLQARALFLMQRGA